MSRGRFITAVANLIVLAPHVAKIKVYANSREDSASTPAPDPLLVVRIMGGSLQPLVDGASLADISDWTKTLWEAISQQ